MHAIPNTSRVLKVLKKVCSITGFECR
jgi:hypothetical protein